MRYAAFISYRHNERDSFIAENLQHELEHYRIPGKIKKSSGRDKVGRIFRDREELPISNNLEDNIQQALEGSEYLIVVCSPESKQSEWVQREVDTFIKLHDKKHVLAVLAKAEPADSFPEILCYDEVEIDNEVGNKVKIRKPVEPLAAEMRGESHKDILKEMKVEKLRLLAPILGCSFDDLKQREKEYKTKRIIWGMTAALAVVGAFAVYAIRQNTLLKKQYKDKQVNESKYLAKVSGEQLEEGDRTRAVQIALEALPEDTENPDRPVTNEAVYALNNSMYSYRCEGSVNYAPDSVCEMDNSTGTYSDRSLTFSRSGKYFAVQDKNGVVYEYDMKNNKKTATIKLSDIDPENEAKNPGAGIEGMCFISDDEMILNYGFEVICLKPADGTVVWKTEIDKDLQQSAATAAVTDDGTKAAFSDGASLIIIDTTNGKVSGSVVFKSDALSLSDMQFCTSMNFSPSGEKLVYSLERSTLSAANDPKNAAIGIIDTKAGKITNPQIDAKDVQYAVFDGENKIDFISYDIVTGMETMSTDQAYSIAQIDAGTGETIWSTPEDKVTIDSNTKCSLSFNKLSDGRKLCAFISNKDLIMNPDTGKIEESSYASDEIEGLAGYDDRMIFIGTKDGKIYMDNLSRKGDLYEMGEIDSDVSYFGYSSAEDTVIQLKDNTQQIVISKPMQDKNYKKLGSFDASTLGYIDKYRYAEHEPYGDDATPAELCVWRAGSDDKCADIKLDDGSCFCSYYMYSSDDSEMIYYITGENSSSFETLHAYSIKDKKETGSLKIKEDDDVVGYSNCDWCEDKAELLLCNANGFEVIDLKTMKAAGTADKKSGTAAKAFSSSDMIMQKAMLSQDGTEVIMFMTAGDNTYNVAVWDISAKKVRDVKDKDPWNIVIASSKLPECCIGRDSDIISFYNGSDICIADLKGMTIKTKIAFAGEKSCKFSFAGNDDQLVTWGDDGHLKMWSVSQNKLLMEDTDSYQNIASIVTDKSTEYFGVLETEYSVNIAHKQLLHVFHKNEDGSFGKYADLGTSIASFDNGEVFSCVSKQLIEYPFYSTQELIDNAGKLTGGEKLSDQDKKKYYISE